MVGCGEGSNTQERGGKGASEGEQALTVEKRRQQIVGSAI